MAFNIINRYTVVTLNTQNKLAEEKDINFVFAFKDDITEWDISSWDLNTIVANLLNNTFKAVLNNNDRYVGLEFKNHNNNKMIIVSNNGSKISKKQKTKIFDQGYSTKGSGRGYGLQKI
ncbi:ATP-binding protein [Natranaerobius trueperi]|uniref:Histidine kinase/HSP90-like ATPase domain-containing protein n=1 Tax=Natranaerobius trueperi TaxID=759412 RepID=A0A226BX84_9FIRM|nr:hypothetical protein CDO51_08805 [Natranaerobius trueperi]